METPEQLMPPPSVNGAASMSNGRSDGLSTEYMAQEQLQNHNQNHIDSNIETDAQPISAGKV